MSDARQHGLSKISMIVRLQGEVYTSSLYLLRGALQRQDVERVVRDVLANPLIQQWRITAAADWQDTCLKPFCLPLSLGWTNHRRCAPFRSSATIRRSCT